MHLQCGKVTMPELTLARFILEFSLMNYELITLSDSKVAAACLFMALRMNNKVGWNKTFEYYSGKDQLKNSFHLKNIFKKFTFAQVSKSAISNQSFHF